MDFNEYPIADYDELFFNANDAMLIVYKKKIIKANKKALLLFNIEENKLTGREIREFAVNDDWDFEYIATNSLFDCILKDNENNTFLAEISVSKVNEKGLFIAIIRNNEKLRKIEAQYEEYKRSLESQIEESRRLYIDLVEKAEIAITIIDPKGKLLYFNSEFLELTGYSDDEIQKNTARMLIHPDDFTIVNSIHTEMCLGNNVQSKYSFKVQKKSGEIITVEVYSAPVYERGKIIGTRSYIWDISDRKKAELHWHEAKEKLGRRLRYEEALGSCSRELLVNSDFAVQEALGHLLRATQVSRVYIYKNVNDKELGLCMSLRNEVCAPGIEFEKDNPELKLYPYENGFARWREELSTGNLIFGDVRYFPDTERKYLELTGIKSLLTIPIKVSGEWYGFIGFNDQRQFRDWSEEVSLLQTAADLISAYIERQKSQDMLHRAKEEAEKISELKSQFLANVSHEIRTPMNGIIGFSEIIMNTESLDTAKEKANSIINESESLLVLINEILDHTKIEAGKTSLELMPANLFKLLENISEFALVQTKNKGIDYKLSIGNEVPQFIVCDPLRLRQVIMNLITNAVKFTSEGGVKLTAKLNEQTGGKAKIYFAVEDSGIGIPKEKQATIFDSYTQADGSTTRKYGGTGLGTTISKQLVELMGGEINLISEPGKGSTFHFTVEFKLTDPIPLEKEDIEGNKDIQEILAAERKKKTTRILLVEDYPPNQEVARMHLEAAGHKVDIAENGLIATELCKLNFYNIILMDIQMPVMDGFEATNIIRKECKNNINIPIIALTANADAGTLNNCLDKGMNDLITKPIRRNKLLAIVDKWLFLTNKPVNGPNNDDQEDFSVDTMPPFNYDVALDEFGSIELIEDVATHFMQNVEQQIPILENAVKLSDMETIRRETHKIKGGAATMEAHPLAEAAKKLEELSKMGKSDDIPFAFNKLISEFTILKDFLKCLF